MGEHDLLVFLFSLAILLSVARLLGEGARRLGFPLIFGELASGILLGPTVLGRITPSGQHALFPGGVPGNMLAGYTNVGVVLLLAVAGLEVNLAIVRRRGKSASGADFNAPDGADARIVFLLLMPPRAHDQEVRILASIARAAIDPAARERLLQVQTEQELVTILGAKRSPEDVMRASRTTLANL